MGKSSNNGLKYALISIGTVIVVFLIIIVAKSPTTPSLNSSDTLAPSSLVNMISSIKTSVLDAIGVGTANTLPKQINAPALSSGGKPEVVYEGAEYCPYCATERWAMAVALSRFGTFTGLKQTHSSSTDVYPNTQTLSFYQSTFTSPYIVFTPVELYSNIAQGTGYETLQTPTPSQKSLMSTYDAPPYVSSANAGAIPFIDFGGKYLITGATYNPSVLQGESGSEIASALSNSSSAIAKGADGAANTMIAAICNLTKNQPSSVCTTKVQSIESSLN